MIDPKYLDMLKKQPSIAEKISGFLNDTIDRLITGAICDISDEPIPEELGFEEIHLGIHRKTGRQLIIGDTDDRRSVQVEFSDDFKKGYLAKNGLSDYEEVVLTPDTSNAAKTLFDTIHQKITAMSFAALPRDPKSVALSEFLSDTRYGTNEYLCNEYLEIYKRVVTEMVDQIANDEIKETVLNAVLNLEVTDIRQFLKDNGVDPDTANVHVIG